MERRPYLAHVSEDGREQSVLEHLTGTAALCSAFASAFGAAEQGRLAGMAHDLGKYSAAFQKRLLENGSKVDHSTAGAFECWKRRQCFAAFAAAGHHSGLPDGGGQGDSSDRPTLLGRLKRAAEGELAPYDSWTAEASLPAAVPPDIGQTQPEGMFFTRMLYSCLTDADFLDTEAFMAGAPVPRGGGETMEALEQKLQSHISAWFPPQTPLNEQRCAALERCLEQGEAQKPGLFTLTIPTGGGKTAASLAFALCHARVHGLRRIIYVAPYTSIIEQNAKVFRDILGGENVLEHHSGALYETGPEATPLSVRMGRATENWDMPAVVTTAVQFFESLFAARSSQCRKLHNIAGSVVIFDEAQMLPVPYLRPCVFAIAQLVKRYRVSAVLCTATQPALEDIFRGFLPEFPAVELCPPGTFREELFRRVTFRRAGKLSWEDLAAKLNGRRQVLCVVNSRKNAQEVYTRLNPEGSFHLSTLMYPAHRKAVLAEIRSRLKSGRPCRVVSTSLIEAGVDVDFPAVFREEAGLDSILQTAGRCNREGKRPAAESIAVIFQAETAPPPLFAIPTAAGAEALKRCGRPDSREAMSCYFQTLLTLKGFKALDQQGILTIMRDDQSFMPFRTVSERFRLIDSATRTIYIPAGKGGVLVSRLLAGERSRELFRELGQYGVSVYEDHFKSLYEAGDLEMLDEGCVILTNPALYDDSTGLSLEADSGKALFI